VSTSHQIGHSDWNTCAFLFIAHGHSPLDFSCLITRHRCLRCPPFPHSRRRNRTHHHRTDTVRSRLHLTHHITLRRITATTRLLCLSSSSSRRCCRGCCVRWCRRWNRHRGGITRPNRRSIRRTGNERAYAQSILGTACDGA
jgi:hypothetical protein